MLYVVAGTHSEYLDWGLNQKKYYATDTRYVSSVDQIRGLSTIEGVFIGTCYDRPDIQTIVNHINVIRSRTAKPIIKVWSLSHLSSHVVPEVTSSPQGLHDKTLDKYLASINTTIGMNLLNTPTTSYYEYCGADMRGTTFDRFIADEIKNT